MENDTVEIVRRDNRQKQVMPIEQLNETIEKIFESIHKDLFNKAEKYLKEKTAAVSNYKGFTKTMSNSDGFVLAGWCGKEECELKIKEETGADIRVIPFNQEELEKEELENCVFCGSKSGKKVIFARAY
jgi:prolyl-tRNA synthetase